MSKIQSLSGHSFAYINGIISKLKGLRIPPLDYIKYIAELEDEASGAAYLFVWKNGHHPNADYFTIYVPEDMRRNGYGSELLEHLKGKCKSDRLQISVYSSEKEALGFLEHHGFECKRKTYDCHFFKKIECDEKVLKFSELDEATLNYVFSDSLKEYRNVHAHVNAASDSLGEEQWRRINSDLDMELSKYSDGDYIMVFNDEIPCIAYSSGKNGKIKALLAAALNKCDLISAEIDDDSPEALRLKDLADFTDEVTYNCYVLKIR